MAFWFVGFFESCHCHSIQSRCGQWYRCYLVTCILRHLFLNSGYHQGAAVCATLNQNSVLIHKASCHVSMLIVFCLHDFVLHRVEAACPHDGTLSSSTQLFNAKFHSIHGSDLSLWQTSRIWIGACWPSIAHSTAPFFVRDHQIAAWNMLFIFLCKTSQASNTGRRRALAAAGHWRPPRVSPPRRAEDAVTWRWRRSHRQRCACPELLLDYGQLSRAATRRESSSLLPRMLGSDCAWLNIACRTSATGWYHWWCRPAPESPAGASRSWEAPSGTMRSWGRSPCAWVSAVSRIPPFQRSSRAPSTRESPSTKRSTSFARSPIWDSNVTPSPWRSPTLWVWSSINSTWITSKFGYDQLQLEYVLTFFYWDLGRCHLRRPDLFHSIVSYENFLNLVMIFFQDYCCLIALSSPVASGLWYSLIVVTVNRSNLGIANIDAFLRIAIFISSLWQQLSQGRCSMRCPDSKLNAWFTMHSSMLACSLCLVSMTQYCIELKLLPRPRFASSWCRPTLQHCSHSHAWFFMAFHFHWFEIDALIYCCRSSRPAGAVNTEPQEFVTHRAQSHGTIESRFWFSGSNAIAETSGGHSTPTTRWHPSWTIILSSCIPYLATVHQPRGLCCTNETRSRVFLLASKYRCRLSKCRIVWLHHWRMPVDLTFNAASTAFCMVSCSRWNFFDRSAHHQELSFDFMLSPWWRIYIPQWRQHVVKHSVAQCGVWTWAADVATENS